MPEISYRGGKSKSLNTMSDIVLVKEVKKIMKTNEELECLIKHKDLKKCPVCGETFKEWDETTLHKKWCSYHYWHRCAKCLYEINLAYVAGEKCICEA